MVKVDIEYCGFCDFQSECEDIAKTLKMLNPNVEVKCHRGRKGAFEVKIDEKVIYSKLDSENLPNFQKITNTVVNAFNEVETRSTSSGFCALM
ncbi:migration and invasion enhancer 1 [Hermetia illucens]|uniref:migration and invasion enhancer 1 n=1 Tax=Hermetia illucens TaxID=343691 RepID=UPI0018CC03C6|nr:migration and invasion enhancer 1 [Hermetia illucens]